MTQHQTSQHQTPSGWEPARMTVVSGSASGIGAAVARQLRQRGEQVHGVDRQDADTIADLATAEGCQRAVEQILESTGGRIDALVLCAGTSVPSPQLPLVNHFGAVRLAEGLRDALAGSVAPRVVVVASVAGITQTPDQGVLEACLAGDADRAYAAARTAIDEGRARQLYPASKNALSQWVRRSCISPGWADAGIALNAAAPGIVMTPMTEPLWADEQMVTVMKQAMPTPLNPHASADDIARFLVWLVSPENTHLTGQVIPIDGGVEATLRAPEVF